MKPDRRFFGLFERVLQPPGNRRFAAVAVESFAGLSLIRRVWTLCQSMRPVCIFGRGRLFDGFAVAQERVSGCFVVVSECLKTLADVAAADDARGVVGGMACPVAVEVVRYFADDAAGGEDVQVGENGVLTDFEVFVADIASAEYGGAVVGGKGFVVHAAVEAGKSVR